MTSQAAMARRRRISCQLCHLVHRHQPSRPRPLPFRRSAVGRLILRPLLRAAPALADAIPALTGAGSAAAGALPFLFIPTNTQSETTDLSDGLRARVRPGQRTVEIERRVE